MPEQLAFIGLGVMGHPMAGHLARAGHHVTVYNRNTTKAADWVEVYGGKSAASPAAAAEKADYIFCCVGNDDDLREVALGKSGILESIRPDAIFVDHTTVSATLARILSEKMALSGAHFIDAPVSGGQVGAERGTLSVMAGGEMTSFARVRPLIDCYAGYAKLLGPAGSGQMAKMVNQICIAGLVQALSEGLNFARCAGMDIEAVVDVISRGAAQSWQMNNRSKTMSEGDFDFGFAIDWMRKDLAIALDEAGRNGALLPVTATVDQFYAELQRRGKGRWDTSALISLLDEHS